MIRGAKRVEVDILFGGGRQLTLDLSRRAYDRMRTSWSNRDPYYRTESNGEVVNIRLEDAVALVARKKE